MKITDIEVLLINSEVDSTGKDGMARPWRPIILKINTDEGYRKKLEKGAREYYEKWLAPEKVITRLLECAKINK